MADPLPGDHAAAQAAGPTLPSLDDLALEGTRVLARVDINSPVEDGEVVPSARLRAAARTVQALIDRGAGVVLLAHQGRPGSPDFTSLEQHAALLSQEAGLEVSFAPHIDDEAALQAVQAVAPGDILLLENVRMAQGEIDNVAAETHAERPWVTRLAGAAEAFVMDAFSAAHRSHASIVGFPLLLPAAAGPLLQAEIDALSAATEDAQGQRVLVLGGAKVEDALKVLNHHLEGGLVDEALCGGLVGELFLVSRGHDLGGATTRVLEKAGASGFQSLANGLVETYDRAIVTPLDVAYTDEGQRVDCFIEELPAPGKILDIGPATGDDFAQAIEQAETVILNGPMGAYERAGFDLGTRRVLEAVAQSEAYTLIGGGHTVTAMEHFGIDQEAFSHVSLAGGALITYLTGDPLPGLEALQESRRRFALAPESS